MQMLKCDRCETVMARSETRGWYSLVVARPRLYVPSVTKHICLACADAEPLKTLLGHVSEADGIVAQAARDAQDAALGYAIEDRSPPLAPPPPPSWPTSGYATERTDG